MVFFFLLLFFGIHAALFLVMSNFTYKRQSFILGITGACLGGIVGLIIKNGLSIQTAEIMFYLFTGEVVFYFIMQRYFLQRRGY
jgi:hypothetical protein